MITIKCTYLDETFFKQLVDLCEEYSNIKVEGFDSNYFADKKKGYLKCKSAFAAKKDPFIGIWINDLPRKGFYSEIGECTLENIRNYLNNLPEDDYKGIDSYAGQAE